MNNDGQYYDDMPTILTLTDEEGVSYQFEVIDEMDYNGERYTACVEYFEDPRDALDADPALIIFRIGEPDEDGLDTFDVVDDDDEYLEVGQIFEKRFEESYFDEDDLS